MGDIYAGLNTIQIKNKTQNQSIEIKRTQFQKADHRTFAQSTNLAFEKMLSMAFRPKEDSDGLQIFNKGSISKKFLTNTAISPSQFKSSIITNFENKVSRSKKKEEAKVSDYLKD